MTSLNMKRHGLPEFAELKTSTRTIMVYTNVSFDLQKIFESLYITPIYDVPLTKKKKNIDRKNLKAPYGAVIGLRKGDKFRGINIRKTKTVWCTLCQPSRKINSGSVTLKKINTVVEKTRPVKNTEDIKEILLFCEKCQTFYGEKDKKIPSHFLNQVTISLSIESVILNIMLFKDSLKIAGCKNDNDAVHGIMILWQDYISKVPGAYCLKSEPEKSEPSFLFKQVMRNVDFRMGFPIDRQRLNTLMNSSGCSDVIRMSHCETTGNTNVNIKMVSKKPKGYQYDCLVMPIDKDPFFTKMAKNTFRSAAKKKRKEKYTTFIVFSSSEVILSGRYEENMKDMYMFFIGAVFENRDFIEEKICTPAKYIMDALSVE